MMALHLSGVVLRRKWKPPRLQPWEGRSVTLCGGCRKRPSWRPSGAPLGGDTGSGDAPVVRPCIHAPMQTAAQHSAANEASKPNHGLMAP